MLKPSAHPRTPQIFTPKPAVRQIVSALREQRQERPTDFPYFLIVGAGISVPSVPLAEQLVAHCQERCTLLGIPPDELPTTSSGPLDRYAAWFNAAYPHRADRQRFFIRQIERASISPAVLRLAHLLLPDAQPLLQNTLPETDTRRARPLTNVVVTPNFDDLLARALRLFGADTVVCDHPRVTERIDLDRHDVLQLVHVHGSYRFYDGCNLRAEIEERARHGGDDSTESMLGLLQVLLRDRSPIVVGYSGWEGDVIMTALRQRLTRSAPLPRNCYWFCYRRGEADSAPGWLAGHPDVRFVVAEPPPAASHAALGNRTPMATEQRADEMLAEPGTLPAARVFGEFISQLGLQAPRLTDDPLGFFADHLERLLPRDHEPVYAVPSVIQTVRRAVERERAARDAQTQAVRDAGDRLKAVLDAVRRADYEMVVKSAHDVPLDALENAQRLDFETALEQTYLALDGRGAAFDACVLRVKIAEAALTPTPTLEWQVRHARAWHAVGYCHDMAGRSADGLKAYEQVLSPYGESLEPRLQERVAWALVNKGVTLGRLGQSEGELDVYNEIERRFGSATEPGLREQVAMALFNKGVTLGTLGQSEAALGVYNEVEQRFGSASEPALRERVARALVNKGVTLGRLGQSEAELDVYNEVEQRFGSASEPALREQVAMALFNKGLTLGRLGQSEAELGVYNEVEQRFGSASEPALREQVAWALVNKGNTLGRLGQSEAALAVYDDIERRFASDERAETREAVERARAKRARLTSTPTNKQ